MTRAGPLASIKVLDLSRLLPGPYASLVLVDLGADVVKIEDTGVGDSVRLSPPEKDGMGVAFAALNRGKRSLALDLKNEGDRKLLLDLAKKADVVLESFRPGVMARLGVGWEQLSAINPRLVLCSISGYGQNGPYATKAGHDLNYLALSGVLDLLGSPDGQPAHPNVQVADVAGGGLAAVAGILAALVERGVTGRGRWVDISMTEGAMSTAFMTLSARAAGVGPEPTRGLGPLSGELPCYSIYPTSDGRSLAVGALEPKFWIGFCQAIGRPDLESSGHFGGEDGARAKAEVAAIIAAKPLAHWSELFGKLDVCVEAVLTADEVLAHRIHEARGAFFPGPHGRTQRGPIRFADREDVPATGKAPELGADRSSIVSDWLGAAPRES